MGAECFSHDGKHIAYGSNEDNFSNMLVHIRGINIQLLLICNQEVIVELYAFYSHLWANLYTLISIGDRLLL